MTCFTHNKSNIFHTLTGRHYWQLVVLTHCEQYLCSITYLPEPGLL